jgi:hypothetical protein
MRDPHSYRVWFPVIILTIASTVVAGAVTVISTNWRRK